MKKRKKMGYVADQQGCLEVPKSEGGTLAADDRSGEVNVVRVGAAKTKGKWRVVTMQSAYVKRVLRPAHEALYDHLSSFGWIVRGEVTSSHFKDAVRALEEGEDIISGDYESATDNIYLPIVQMIVDEVARAAEGDLTEEERRVLIGSFTDLKWRSKSGKLHRILRGSMMGNLMSFPVLCILNKACFDLTSDYFHDPCEGRERFGRFNGDDCLFTGNKEFFSKWREVTSWFGLVVNVSKTGTSRRYGELNSNCFDYYQNRIIAKPTLGFLRKTSEPGEILTSVLDGIRSFRPEVQQRIVHVVMRYEISVKGIQCNSIPAYIGVNREPWLKNLLRKKWFRRALEVGPVPIIDQKTTRYNKKEKKFEKLSTAEKRIVPVRQGPLPRERDYELVEELTAQLSEMNQEFWKGRRVRPFEYKISRKHCYDRYNKKIELREGTWRFERGKHVWLWPAELLEFWEFNCSFRPPHRPGSTLISRECRRESSEPLYHPFISWKQDMVFKPTPLDPSSFSIPPSLIPQKKEQFLSLYFGPPPPIISRSFREKFLSHYSDMYDKKTRGGPYAKPLW